MKKIIKKIIAACLLSVSISLSSCYSYTGDISIPSIHQEKIYNKIEQDYFKYMKGKYPNIKRDTCKIIAFYGIYNDGYVIAFKKLLWELIDSFI